MSGERFGTIIADPNWNYRVNHRRGAASNHYETMTDDLAIEELFEWPIQEIAKDDAVLLLWVTGPKILERPGPGDLIQAWGFEHVTMFPWVKIVGVNRGLFDGEIWIEPKWGTGYWIRGAAEYVVIARRGRPRVPENPPVGLLGDRIVHSRKPLDVHDYAETFLDGPYLELYAREPRRGWETWGMEVDGRSIESHLEERTDWIREP